MATPAVFKTPIVNVTHGERRHIAARSSCVAYVNESCVLNWQCAEQRQEERKIARIISGGEKEEKEETKARIVRVRRDKADARSSSWVTVFWVYVKSHFAEAY